MTTEGLVSDFFFFFFPQYSVLIFFFFFLKKMGNKKKSCHALLMLKRILSAIYWRTSHSRSSRRRWIVGLRTARYLLKKI